ncbi:serine hydrolase [Myxococcaceae bacterium JPH2]|nr:serine hydrolase [Myxococcaceae bacterium JPH2]
MHSALAALLVAASLGANPAVPEPSEPRALAARVDAAIDRAIAEKRIVGTVVLVAQDGQVVYHRAAGALDREAGRPMREDAVFRLASMTKPLVSAAALALVEQHQLELDAPITKWLPTFRPKLPDGREPVITVRNLLTHSAGLTYGFFEPGGEGPYHRAGVSDGLDASGLSLEENLRRIASVPLSYEPGTRWAYSVATDVLGAVVARAAGVPLPEAVERLVTKPLGMTDTSFLARDAARLAPAYADGRPEPTRMQQDNQVVPFGTGGVRFAPSRALDARAFPSGGAGMVGTAADYLKFLEALRRGGTPIVTAASVKELSTAQRGEEAQTQGPGWGFGLLSAVLVDPAKSHGPQSAGTLQWGGAYGHSWFVDAKKGLSVVAITNTAFEGMSGATGMYPSEIRDAVYGATAPAAAPAKGVRLYTLDCGRIDLADMGMFSDTGEHAGEAGSMPAPCFLIQHPKGNLLWDTGLGDAVAKLPDGLSPMPGVRFHVATTLASQLAQLGLKPADIQYVGISHMHADHMGNALAFPQATWFVNEAELKRAQSLSSPAIGVNPALVKGHAKAKTTYVDLDQDVFGDGTVRLIKAPGHTVGHRVLMVKLAKTGAVILSGDLFHTRENFEKSLVPPFNDSRADTLASIDRINRLMRNSGARLVVQHEWADFNALPKFPAYLE